MPNKKLSEYFINFSLISGTLFKIGHLQNDSDFDMC